MILLYPFSYLTALAKLPAHGAEEVNEIPAALAKRLAYDLNVLVNDEIVQINTVGHTGSDGFHRLANQAAYTGNIAPGRYLVIDDSVGQGGTLANLTGYVYSQGDVVVGATVSIDREALFNHHII